MKKSSKKGFTLVELVIVIAVIAILSAILIPTFGNVIANARKSAAQSEASNAITAYLTDHATEGFEFTNGYVVVLDGKEELITKNAEGSDYAVKDATIAYLFKYENGRMGDAMDIPTGFKYTATDATLKNEILNVGTTDNATNIVVKGANLTCKNVYLLDGTIETTGTGDSETVSKVSAKIIFLGMTDTTPAA